MAETDTRSWHRREAETDRAYRAFQLYLSQPSPRTFLYVRNAGYAPASVQSWKTEHAWVKRAVDYDNYRADAIMDQDVNLVTLYQKRVTEAGLEDMQVLRGMWLKAAEKLATEASNNYEKSAGDLIKELGDLTRARLDIDKLSRLAARMPDSHKALTVPEDNNSFPEEIIQLKLDGGPVSITSLGNGEDEDGDEE